MSDELRIKGAAGRASLEGHHDKTPSEDGEVENDGAANPPLPVEQPPLPDEQPPLPEEAPPTAKAQDDGWDAQVDPASGQWYFVNRFTGKSQWENPRVPNEPPMQTGPPSGVPSSTSGAPGTNTTANKTSSPPPARYMGYNPKIHGDYDPNADYAKFHELPTQEAESTEPAVAEDMIGNYAQQATFNRFTGKFQGDDKNPEHHNDENKSKRQMNAFFDVDSAANAHEGRSLKAERANQKLSKKEVKAFNDRRRERKEKKRRDFLLS